MKICVITPTSHLRVFAPLGEMDMVLSHLVLPNGGDNVYANYYKEQRIKGRFIILDNSLFECETQGVGVGIDACLDAAEIIKPNEIIAEDILFNGPATVLSTQRFITRMKERGVFGKYQVMAVVQGRTIEEWLNCFHQLIRLPINTIGLSKLSIPISFLGENKSAGCVARARLDCTETISAAMSSAYLLERKMVHLLGGDNWTAWEIEKQKRHKWIRSNDSSCAVWYGSYGDTFDEDGKIKDIRLEKPDLENENIETEQRVQSSQVSILKNIVLWHKAAK